MKKLIICALLAIGLAGCSDYLDVNTDPNYPSAVENNLLIPSAQGYLAAVVGGNIHNIGAFFAQYTEQMPEANQYNELCEYRPSTDLFGTPYTNLYAGVLEDLKVIQRQAEAVENWGDYYLAAVLRAYTFQVLVDYLDNVPYTEALQGSANSMPKWDKGEDVYAGILTELDEAEAKLENMSSMSNDMILDKTTASWIKFANALRLRIYMRASYAQDNSAQVKALIAKNNFFSGDVKFDNFSDEADKRNPWYTTNVIGLAQNHVGSYPIVTYLKETEDPRLPVIFKKATGPDEYVGEIPGSKTQLTANKNSAYSFLQTNAVAPVYLYTQSELQFFLAEAHLRFNNDDAKAKAAYEKAIDANLSTRGMSANGSEIYGEGKHGAWNSSASTENKLKQIGIQKWVALCMINNTEAWSEVRRTGYPAVSSLTAKAINDNPGSYTIGELIVPWVNALGTEMVQSIYYPQTAVNLNDNTPPQKKITDKIWWDKK